MNPTHSIPTPFLAAPGRRRPAQESWSEAHDSCQTLARTVIETTRHGRVIVSTVILATGNSRLEGPFVLYETRTFGGVLEGSGTSFRRSGKPKDRPGVAHAMQEHRAAVDGVIASGF